MTCIRQHLPGRAPSPTGFVASLQKQPRPRFLFTPGSSRGPPDAGFMKSPESHNTA